MSYRKVIVTRFGGPEVLEMIEEPTPPEPKPGEARIRVLVTSAAFSDVMIRKGKYPDVKEKPPFSLGYDLVGVVDRVGAGVTHVQVGQRVAALTVIGAYADYLCLAAKNLIPVPEEVDPVLAVSLVLTYVTAYQLLHRIARVKAEQRIIIHGAGGAVGTAVLQLGRLLNLEMYGTASLSKHAVVADLGATPIDYRDHDWVEGFRALTGGDGADAVFDPMGGKHWQQSFQVLRRGGILVGYGFHNAVMGKGGSIPLDFVRLALWNGLPNGRSTAFYSITGLRNAHPQWFQEDLATLFTLLQQRQIQPIIAAEMPLAEVRRAHERLEAGEVQGKIVLRVQGSPGWHGAVSESYSLPADQ